MVVEGWNSWWWRGGRGDSGTGGTGGVEEVVVERQIRW